MPSLRLRRRTAVALASFALLATGCDSSTPAPTPPASSAVPAASSGAVAPKATAEPSDPSKPSVRWKGIGLKMPEGIAHDDRNDVYVVTNVDGDPLDADGKGFVSKLTPDGLGVEIAWLESGKNGVKLNAPKGMAFAGDTLWIADIDTVRLFDRKTGAPTGEVKIPGSTFLNDVALAPDGRVLVSDSGLKRGGKGPERSGTDAVYAIDKDKKVTTVAKAKELGRPNGLLPAGGSAWVASFDGEVYMLDASGKKTRVQKLPKATLDGIVLVGADLVVSSWEAGGIYRGPAGGELKLVLEGLKSPADMAYDRVRHRLVVPLFEENEVRAYDMQ